MNIRSVSDVIYANPNDRERMEKMNEIYYSMADYLHDRDPKAYEKYCEQATGILYSMTTEEAQQVVMNMRPYGQHWDMETVNEFVESMGDKPSIEYYLALNMAYNDYHRTATEFGVDKPEFYFGLARDFIHDVDAKPYKVQRYFKDGMQ